MSLPSPSLFFMRVHQIPRNFSFCKRLRRFVLTADLSCVHVCERTYMRSKMSRSKMMGKVKNDTISDYNNGLIKQLKIKIDRSTGVRTIKR